MRKNQIDYICSILELYSPKRENISYEWYESLLESFNIDKELTKLYHFKEKIILVIEDDRNLVSENAHGEDIENIKDEYLNEISIVNKKISFLENLLLLKDQ